MCYYENIIDERKDLEPLIRAKKKFEFIIKEYPDTDFALDAAFKIGLIKDIMAAKSKIKTKTHTLARKQYNWFKPNDHSIHWFDSSRPNYSNDVHELVQTFLKS